MGPIRHDDRDLQAHEEGHEEDHDDVHDAVPHVVHGEVLRGADRRVPMVHRTRQVRSVHDDDEGRRNGHGVLDDRHILRCLSQRFLTGPPHYRFPLHSPRRCSPCSFPCSSHCLARGHWRCGDGSARCYLLRRRRGLADHGEACLGHQRSWHRSRMGRTG
jgi:hypothetical protein